MKLIKLFSNKLILLVVASMLLSSSADALIYHAANSGNLSDTATWGGPAPVANTSGDIIIIHPGVTVTLDTDFEVNGILDLDSGMLALNGYDLAFNITSDLITTGAGHINSMISSDIIIRCDGLSSNLTFGIGSVIHDLTIIPANSISNVNLGSDVIIAGTLTLGAGTFSLGSNTLTFASDGDFSATGTGSFLTTAASGIGIQTNNSISGPLRFSPSGNILNNLVINFPDNSNDVTLGSDLKLRGTLVLSQGKLITDTHDLMMEPGSVIIGGSYDSYVVATNGGRLVMRSMENTSTQYPVGTGSSYCPALIYANAGSATSFIGFSLADVVYENGYNGTLLDITKPLVKATWFMTSTNATGLDLTTQLSWNAGMEVNNFNRTQAYISHNVSGHWDNAPTGPATGSNNFFSITRNNITRPGPLTIADMNSALDVKDLENNTNAVVLYPNPATDVLNYSSAADITNVTIYDISGRIVRECSNSANKVQVGDLAPGHYLVQFTGNNFTTVQRFIRSN